MSIGDTGIWSKPFSLDAVGTSSAVSIPFKQNGAEVHLGMSTQEGEGKVCISRAMRLNLMLTISVLPHKGRDFDPAYCRSK